MADVAYKNIIKIESGTIQNSTIGTLLKIAKALIYFIIISQNNYYRFYEKLNKQKTSVDYVADGNTRHSFCHA